MKLSSLILLSIGSVKGQENVDLSQLQALLQLPGAQELLGKKQSKSRRVTPILASLNKPEAASPAAPPAERPVEASQPEIAEPVVAQDVDTDPDIHVIPGQMQAASGEVSNVPPAETVLSTTNSSLNQL